MFTVAIIDDRPIARAGLAEIAAGSPEFTVIACASAAPELDALARPPDVALLRLEAAPPGRVLSAIDQLSRRAGVVATSAWDRPPSVLSVLRAGARACLTLRSEPRTVLAALSTVARGGVYVCSELVPRLQAELNGGRRVRLRELAPREVETLSLIARGLTHAQIARRMGLTPATVNTYVNRLRAKLHAGNKAELTRRAVELGHVDVDRPDDGCR